MTSYERSGNRSASPTVTSPRTRANKQRACDACRLRKVGCERESGREECAPCLRMEIPCTFNHVVKRPGPPPGYRRNLSAGPGRRASVNTSTSRPSRASPRTRTRTRTSISTKGIHSSSSSSPPLLSTSDLNQPSIFVPDTTRHDPAPFHYYHGDLGDPAAARHQYDRSIYVDPLDHRRESGTTTIYQLEHNTGTAAAARHDDGIGAAGWNTANSNSIDAVIDPRILHLIVDLYYDYVYWLVPFPHRPSFERELALRREEQRVRDGMGLHVTTGGGVSATGTGGGNEDEESQEFTAMVFALVSFALALVPHQLVPLSLDELKALLRICLRKTQDFLARDYTSFTVNRMFILYCTAGVLLELGMPAKSREHHGANLSLALQKELDRESTYAGMDPLEREKYRRIWWLIYCSDRSGACCEGARPMIDEDLVSDIALPSVLDDESLDRGVDPMTVPLDSDMYGFYYSSLMWRIAGKLLTRREKDSRHPPTGVSLLTRLVEVDELIDELDGFMDGCPESLVIALDPHIEITSPEFHSSASGPSQSLIAPSFSSGSGSGAVSRTKHGNIIQQSNLYVSQQAIRLVAIQYRKLLADLRRPPADPPIIVQPLAITRWESRLLQNEAVFKADRDQVLSNLLRVLRALPLELMAVNKFPGMTKIRYVASTILSDFEAINPRADDAGSQGLFKALSYLEQYIDYLSRLEQLSSLTE